MPSAYCWVFYRIQQGVEDDFVLNSLQPIDRANPDVSESTPPSKQMEMECLMISIRAFPEASTVVFLLYFLCFQKSKGVKSTWHFHLRALFPKICSDNTFNQVN
jgi:hypothetical protein